MLVDIGNYKKLIENNCLDVDEVLQDVAYILDDNGCYEGRCIVEDLLEEILEG